MKLEFINDVSPLFEDFICFFQRSCPQVHILLKPMSRFLKSAHEGMRGSKMQDIDCGRRNQLYDSEIVIGDPAKKACSRRNPFT